MCIDHGITKELRYAVTTVERMVTAIRAHHRAAGQPPPDSYAARELISAYRAQLHEEHHPRARPRRAAPVTNKELAAMVDALDRSTPIGCRDAAVILLGRDIAGRGGEIARLNIEDLTERDEGLEVAVWRPKVNRDDTVAVPYRSNPSICPVRAVRASLAVLANHGRTAGPLFVRIDRHSHLAVRLRRGGKAIGDPDGRLSTRAISNLVARTAQAAALPSSHAGQLAERWTAHSLRRGLVTAARRAGKPLEEIGRHGGWADGSRQVLTYSESEDHWVSNILYGLD